MDQTNALELNPFYNKILKTIENSEWLDFEIYDLACYWDQPKIDLTTAQT
jgi:hypothetical protein